MPRVAERLAAALATVLIMTAMFVPVVIVPPAASVAATIVA